MSYKGGDWGCRKQRVTRIMGFVPLRPLPDLWIKERRKMKHKDHLINHVALVLDASSSMQPHASELIKVADAQVARLAQLSQQLNQETRVTVYTFAEQVECVVFDMDVLRLPSIASFYRAHGNTALIDAAVLSQQDLAMTMQKYGDHAFLTILLTDGEENRSRFHQARDLSTLLSAQADNWTFAAMVPNIMAKREAQRYGIPRDNISVWDPSDKAGMAEAGETMAGALDNYMVARSTGTRGTRTLFSTAPDAVNADAIKAAQLTPLDPQAYMLVPVVKPRAPQGVLNKDKHRVWEISDFTRHATGNFTVGSVFYELSKKEKIQGNKALAVLEVASSKVFSGAGVRDLIGLPAVDASVAPDFNPNYKIYVQSTSVNRHLVPGTKLLVLK